jgi:hypothetical protein
VPRVVIRRKFVALVRTIADVAHPQVIFILEGALWKNVKRAIVLHLRWLVRAAIHAKLTLST